MSKLLWWFGAKMYGPGPCRCSSPWTWTRTPQRRARLRAESRAKAHATPFHGSTRCRTTAIVPIEKSMPRKIQRLRSARARQRSRLLESLGIGDRTHARATICARAAHDKRAVAAARATDLALVRTPQTRNRPMRIYFVSPTHYDARRQPAQDDALLDERAHAALPEGDHAARARRAVRRRAHARRRPRPRVRRRRHHRDGAADRARLRPRARVSRPRPAGRARRHLGDAHRRGVAAARRRGRRRRGRGRLARGARRLLRGAHARHLSRRAGGRRSPACRAIDYETLPLLEARGVPRRARSTACTSTGRWSSRAAVRIPASTAPSRPTTSARIARGPSTT